MALAAMALNRALSDDPPSCNFSIRESMSAEMPPWLFCATAVVARHANAMNISAFFIINVSKINVRHGAKIAQKNCNTKKDDDNCFRMTKNKTRGGVFHVKSNLIVKNNRRLNKKH